MLVSNAAQAILQVPSAPSSSSSFDTFKHHKQPLCGDKEGWGPASPIFWDLTPCAEDAIISGVAAFGILFGSAAVYFLSQRKPHPVSKNWHFYAKLVGSGKIQSIRRPWV